MSTVQEQKDPILLKWIWEVHNLVNQRLHRKRSFYDATYLNFSASETIDLSDSETENSSSPESNNELDSEGSSELNSTELNDLE